MKYDRTARTLETAYVVSFSVQLAALAAGFIGLALWGRDPAGPGVWLCLGAVFTFVSCHLFQRHVRRWFRRRPVE